MRFHALELLSLVALGTATITFIPKTAIETLVPYLLVPMANAADNEIVKIDVIGSSAPANRLFGFKPCTNRAENKHVKATTNKAVDGSGASSVYYRNDILNKHSKTPSKNGFKPTLVAV